MCNDNHCYYCQRHVLTEELFGHQICDDCLKAWQESQEQEYGVDNELFNWE